MNKPRIRITHGAFSGVNYWMSTDEFNQRTSLKVDCRPRVILATYDGVKLDVLLAGRILFDL